MQCLFYIPPLSGASKCRAHMVTLYREPLLKGKDQYLIKVACSAKTVKKYFQHKNELIQTS